MAEFEHENFIVNRQNESFVLSNLGEMAGKIAYYNFEWRYLTLVIFDTMRVAASLETFLYTYNQPVALKYGNFLPRHRVKVAQFVIFGHDTNELVHILKWLASSQYDVSAKFIIVCANDDPKTCDQEEAFQTISNVFMVNSIFIKASEGTNEPTAFTYFPMKPTKCQNNIPEEMKTDLKCSNQSCYEAFPEKLNNFFGCALYISTLYQPPYMYLQDSYEEPYGADGDIIKLVSSILNATLKMILPEGKREWGNNVDNNWTGTLGDVFNKRAHASMASIPLTPGKYGNFQISFPYYSMKMVWTTRLPNVKPSWEKLLRPLTTYTRISIYAMFILIIVINTFTKTKIWNRIRKPLNIAQSKSNLLFNSLIVFLGMAIPRSPTKGALKIIVYGWVWFSFIMRCSYQANLFNSLKTTNYDEAFTDIQDVIEAGYAYGGSTSLKEYYSEEPDIIKNWKTLNYLEIYPVLTEVSKGNKDFALAANKVFLIHYLSSSNGSDHLQIIPNQIVTSPTVLYFKKFSPFAQAIDRILIVLVEAGFTDMFYARYLDHDIYLFEHPRQHGATPLGLRFFSAFFLFLGLGWLVSAIYFVIEVKYQPPQ